MLSLFGLLIQIQFTSLTTPCAFLNNTHLTQNITQEFEAEDDSDDLPSGCESDPLNGASNSIVCTG
jgi:hypothetical protein